MRLSRTARRAFGIALVLSSLNTVVVEADEAASKFRPARPGISVALPSDHGAHPDYETEWWYYTGHLVPTDADLFTSTERYGFQLTFFRRAKRGADNTVAQIYLAHAALTDTKTDEFFADSRFAPDTLGVAHAASNRLDVRHLDWSTEQVGSFHVLRFGLPSLNPTHEVRLVGAEPPILLNGERGFSRKGECENCASIYYSLPRITVAGHVVTPGGVRQVHGVAWMDHEYMTNALQPDQEGWDWVSLMFRDGTDLMIFRVRSKEGGKAFVAGTIRRGDNTTALGPDEIVFEPTGERWKSPATGANYPLQFRIDIPRFKIKTVVSALTPNQEVTGHGEEGISYYEGAISTELRDAIGYLEMTGYAKPIGKDL